MADIVGKGAPFDILAATPKYGENPWQGNAGLYIPGDGTDPLAISNFEKRQGAAPSYNNYCDIDRLLQTATHIAAVFERNNGKVPIIALGAKHGNMCGAAVSFEDSEDHNAALRSMLDSAGEEFDSIPEEAEIDEIAIQAMLDGNRRAIFGGSVMMSTVLTEKDADTLMHYGQKPGQKRLLDVVTAADMYRAGQVLDILQRKEGKLRVLTNPTLNYLQGHAEEALDTAQRFRYVRGGVLVQDNYTFVLDHAADYVERPGLQPTEEQERDLSLAWAIGSTSNSNTITLVRNGMLIGNGVGQHDRVGAAELAIKRARDSGHEVEGAVAYSDSFFPFPDGPEVLAKAGVKAILTSRGSKMDDKVFAAIEAAGVALETIPDAVGRGFYAH